MSNKCRICGYPVNICKCKESSEFVHKDKVDDGSKYRKIIKDVDVDIYDILAAFKVCNPAVQHAVKKLLAAGGRGYKDKVTDLEEARWSIERAIELEKD